MGNLGVAVVLGMVEGLTEFLPVSSTGHLIIAGHLLGFVGDKAATFEIAIQSGAILAVVVLYWRRLAALVPIRSLAPGGPEGSAMVGWNGVWRITLASLPALAAGYLAGDAIKDRLFTPGAVAAALIAGGVAILVTEQWASSRRGAKALDALGSGTALGIGFFQILALWPGTSRSAATILGAILLGLDRKAAAEFSFLTAIPVLFAATLYELVNVRSGFTDRELIELATGFVVSFVVALIAIRSFLLYLSRWSLTPFGWYRIAVAPIFYFLTRS
ncbi:MAG TPA: undecaprenyl-diphosphate phosphatase [Candidatus Eisenbacteria bacterium]|nr:undecaprenyl-diphosphate phosphatase [Candidatus Eisenbacteria bacterium]